ncbi:NnrU family protein [Phaeobacter porticola]|uniref:Putative nnrU protein n=1 Tax=Phaeobacter porticola TaxID=1844006 RepID=A0A1L3I0S6_9RHOB|nr:NnrU family protein [Phaeobacter porticola]APG45719.1 putative nnrU protein [Phaeobacter porticola]
MSASWLGFTLSLLLFATSHFVPRLGNLRGWLISTIGRRAYFSAYGLLSLVLFGWVLIAAAEAPYIELWPPAPWQRWAPMLLMPLVFVLAACAIGIDTPFTLGGSDKADPAKTTFGLAALSRHPLLLALLLWSLAHMLANGDLAHVILFGGSGLLALIAMVAFDRQVTTALGQEDAAQYFAKIPIISLSPLTDRAWRQAHIKTVVARTTLGLSLWIATLFLHETLLGVSPLP